MTVDENDHTTEAPPTSRWTAIRRNRVLRVLRGLLLIWVVWCATLFFAQGCLIFPGALRAAPEADPPESAEVWWIDLGGGEQVEAWFLPASECDAEHPCPAVIYCHGNAELIDEEWKSAIGYHRLGWSLLLPEYRGFGRSDGSPSQENIRADFVRFYDRLVQEPRVDPNRVVFHGRSLGGAVAADLAAHRKPAALILESTFTSMGAMAHRFLAPAFLARQPFHTERVVRELDVPVLVFHGTQDNVVPVSHGRSLGESAKYGWYVEYDCGHNDLPPPERRREYWAAIESVLTPVPPEGGDEMR